MYPKKWLKYFFLLSFLLALPITLFNYLMDPLWTFSHSNKYNQNQDGFNERQLKTNKMYFSSLDKYDTLLLGSSRTTYINQESFKGMSVFNLACANMIPSEYQGWIDIAKEIKKKEFKNIIIGIDFWASNSNIIKEKKKYNKDPKIYLEKAKEPFYRYTSLLSYDTFKKSKINFNHFKYPSTTDYTTENIKNTIFVPKERKNKIIKLQYKNYANNVYGRNYNSSHELKSIMRKLKQENPQTNFIIFTTPISAQLFKLLVEKDNQKDYEKWLKEMREIFPNTYNFMGINTITSNPDNYPDLHHFYPSVGDIIAYEISNNNKK